MDKGRHHVFCGSQTCRNCYQGFRPGNAKSVSSPHQEVRDKEEESEPLDQDTGIRYRSCVARLNYLAQDRTDIQFAVKDLCNIMSSPTSKDWATLIRIARCLKGHREVHLWFKYQKAYQEISVWTDSDHTGCHRTRKSTSGGLIMLGNIWLRHGPRIKL